jgi:hypothetical protein
VIDDDQSVRESVVSLIELVHFEDGAAALRWKIPAAQAHRARCESTHQPAQSHMRNPAGRHASHPAWSNLLAQQFHGAHLRCRQRDSKPRTDTIYSASHAMPCTPSPPTPQRCYCRKSRVNLERAGNGRCTQRCAGQSLVWRPSAPSRG